MAGEAYLVRGTPLLVGDSAQTPAIQLTFSALAAGAGQISNRYDRGVSAGPDEYEWKASLILDSATTPTLGETVDFYIAGSDGTNGDGEEGAVDAALTAEDKLKNMQYIGSVVVDKATDLTRFTASGVCRITSRYFSVVAFNNTADPFETSTANHTLYLTPIYMQAQ